MIMMKSAMLVCAIRCFCCFLAAQIFAALLLPERTSGTLLCVKSDRGQRRWLTFFSSTASVLCRSVSVVGVLRLFLAVW